MVEDMLGKDPAKDPARDPASGNAQLDAQLDAVFGALADPTRRQIVGLLREAGELRVTDVAAAFDMSLNGVSKHIKVLERADVLSRRVDGRVHWLRPNWTALQAPYEWLHAHHHFWSQRLDALVDYVSQHKESEDA